MKGNGLPSLDASRFLPLFLSIIEPFIVCYADVESGKQSNMTMDKIEAGDEPRMATSTHTHTHTHTHARTQRWATSSMVVEEGKIKRSRRRRTISLVRLAAPLARASSVYGTRSKPLHICLSVSTLVTVIRSYRCRRPPFSLSLLT